MAPSRTISIYVRFKNKYPNVDIKTNLVDSMVRILHITDVHCNNDSLDKVLRKESFDIVILTGDIQCYDTVELLEPVKGRLLAISGNMDDISIIKRLRDLGVLIDGLVIKKHGLVFVGIGGIDPLTSLQEVETKINNLKIDISLSHHPPKGILDKTLFRVRAGLKEIRNFIERYEPRLHLCGHIHESRGVEKLKNTIVVNPGPLKRGYYALIDYNDEINVSLERL